MEIKINAKISVDRVTAETCLRLVEMFINDNANVDIVCDKLKTGEYTLQFIDRVLPARKGEPILTIVSVKFRGTSNKTYDYEYVGTKPVKVGDVVRVETPQQELKEVEVVDVFKIPESAAEYDYKLAVERLEA